MPPVDPFASFSDDALFNLSLSLELACARTKTTLRNPVRKVLCNGLVATHIAHVNRGTTPPTAPYHYGQLKRDPSGIVA